ncbi:MAG: type II toxin-antitoxin system HicB family antitoxin [Chloroflexota bacterium]|nr:MAG: type II toxin-antitoxin system HicB family antitoxin [Chloroflexota bacterium]
MTADLGEFELTLRIYADDGAWTAECVELDVASFGGTIEEALDNVKDAVNLYLETAIDERQIDRVLRESGVKQSVTSSPCEPSAELPSSRS